MARDYHKSLIFQVITLLEDKSHHLHLALAAQADQRIDFIYSLDEEECFVGFLFGNFVVLST